MSSLEIGRCCLLQQWSRLGGPPGPGRSPLVKKTWNLRIWLRKRLVDGGDFNIFNHVMVDGGIWLQHCLSCYDLPESVPLPGSPPWRLSDLGLRKCWGKPHPPGISSMRNLMGIPDEHQLKLSPQAVQPGPKASKGSGSMAHRGSYGSSHWIAMKMSWEVSVSEMSTHTLCVWMNASSTGCTAPWRWHHLGLIKWRYTYIYIYIWEYGCIMASSRLFWTAFLILPSYGSTHKSVVLVTQWIAVVLFSPQLSKDSESTAAGQQLQKDKRWFLPIKCRNLGVSLTCIMVYPTKFHLKQFRETGRKQKRPLWYWQCHVCFFNTNPRCHLIKPFTSLLKDRGVKAWLRVKRLAPKHGTIRQNKDQNVWAPEVRHASKMAAIGSAAIGSAIGHWPKIGLGRGTLPALPSASGRRMKTLSVESKH